MSIAEICFWAVSGAGLVFIIYLLIEYGKREQRLDQLIATNELKNKMQKAAANRNDDKDWLEKSLTEKGDF